MHCTRSKYSAHDGDCKVVMFVCSHSHSRPGFKVLQKMSSTNDICVSFGESADIEEELETELGAQLRQSNKDN